MVFWYGNGFGFWQMALMWIIMIAFWAMIVWGIYAVVTSTANKAKNERPNENGSLGATEILDQRFAKGEIDTEQYQQMKNLIAHKTHALVNSKNNN